MERIRQGAKVPGSELARVLLADSLRGANRPGNEKAVNRFDYCEICYTNNFCQQIYQKILHIVRHLDHINRVLF